MEMEHAVAALHNDACITIEIEMGYTKLYWKLECCTVKTGASDSGSRAGEIKPGESMNSCFPPGLQAATLGSLSYDSLQHNRPRLSRVPFSSPVACPRAIGDDGEQVEVEN